MSKREITNQKKLAILSFIEEKRHILFGSFKNTNSKEKQSTWKEVLDKAKALELASAERDWTFARDNLFGLWKSRTLSKRDNMRKTGTGGGKDKKFDEVDLAIFRIVDEESAGVRGLEMPEADVGGEACDAELRLPLDPVVVNTIVPKDQGASAVTSGLSTPRASKRKKVESSANYQNLKEELLSVEIYHKRLECLKLERELGINLSVYTTPLFEK